jgi:site-specific DNA-adenine methylase
MSRYHGGKQRLGPLIASRIIEIIDQNNDIEGYCEPFLGMAGVMEPVMRKTIGKYSLRYVAGDINEAVIDMWRSICIGKITRLPRVCSQTRYNKLRSRRKSRRKSRKKSKAKDEMKERAIKGFLGHACSFGGIYMKGFLGSYIKENDSRRKNRQKLPYVRSGNINVSKQATKVERISKILCKANLTPGSYEQFSHLDNYVIYCDPPYAEYNEYYDADRNRIKFDDDKFWKWAKKMSLNNIVLVSGYSAPKGWTALWSSKTKSGQMGSNRSRIEKLFILDNLIK